MARSCAFTVAGNHNSWQMEGTEVTLGEPTPLSVERHPVASVSVIADTNNDGPVYMGGDVNCYYPLYAGSSYNVATDDLHKVYVRFENVAHKIYFAWIDA